MTENDVKKYLKDKIDITQHIFQLLLEELESKSTIENSFKEYILGKEGQITLGTEDERRVGYIKRMFDDVIANLKADVSDNNSLIFKVYESSVSGGIDLGNMTDRLNVLGTRFMHIYNDFNINHPKTYNQGEVIRRIIENLELTPLNITYLDSELFALCYVVTIEKELLIAKENQILFNRIRNEFTDHINNQTPYHDLSTLWWALKIIIYQDNSISNDRKNRFISDFLRMEAIKYITINHDADESKLNNKFITAEGQLKRSLEANKDFVTEFRSLVFCYQNASEVKKWILSLRDPRQHSLINIIREFEDSCSTIGLRWCQDKDIQKWLYNNCLIFNFLNQYWRSRVLEFSEALKIIDGKKTINFLSVITDYKTSNEVFSKVIESLKKSINQYIRIKENKRPLVIGLFGNPGAGKSFLAKKIIEGTIEDIAEINLSTLSNISEFYPKIKNFYDNLKYRTGIPSVFIDEFDSRINKDYIFRLLLTLLWDLKIPDSDLSKHELVKINPSIIFLAASRYETFNDFRDFCVSPTGKEVKAPDLLSRIDYYVDIPRLSSGDRALIINSLARDHASNTLKALCYLAEFEDGSRGLEKLLKGVDISKDVGLEQLIESSKSFLLKTAGVYNTR
jgi:hypothetical protein